MFLYTDQEIENDIKEKNLTPEDYIVIENLTKCKEHLLDYDKKIYVKNLLPHRHSCNNNIHLILEYMNTQGFDPAPFLKEYKKYSRQDLANYFQWISLQDTKDVVDGLFNIIGKKNPRAHHDIVKIALAQDQGFTSVLMTLMQFASIQAISEFVPIANRNYGNDLTIQYVTSEMISESELKIIYTSKSFENFRPNIPFFFHFHFTGILAGMPRRKHYNYGETHFQYYSYDLVKVLTEDYGYLNLKVEEKGNSLYINNQLFAHKVVLKKEEKKCNYSTLTKIKNILRINNLPKKKEIYTANPIEIEKFPKDELEYLLQNRKAAVGYRIVTDLMHIEEGTILNEGEIFNMPYSRIELIINVKDKIKSTKIGPLSANTGSLRQHLQQLRQQVIELEEAKRSADNEAKAAQKARDKLAELNRTLEEKVKDRTKELEEAKNAIEEASMQKTNLFINLAHETKTPLTLIKNYLDKYISKYGMNEELRIISQNISKLLRDMVNFLDSEKLTTGQIFYDHSNIFNISEVLREKVLLFKEIANKKKISLDHMIQEEEIYIKADPYALDRIINNLIDNAIKYTNNRGSIEVLLKTSGPEFQFIVRDTGIGISKEQQKKIFDPYYQISHKKRNIQGIGMGLYIVKKILETLGGGLDVESEEKKGTTFTITLKRHELQKNDKIQTQIKASAPIDTLSRTDIKENIVSNENHNLLLVEDNINLLSYLQTNLNEKFNVYFALNGQEALEKIETIPRPDVILSDIMMDTMDGNEFYDRISKNEKFRDIPFIFLTAKTSIDEKIKALSDGAIDYIYKPFSIDMLIAKINAIIRSQNIKNALYEKDKFATLGMLFSGISHEILNPLAGVYAPLENLERKINKHLNEEGQQQMAGYIDRIYKNLERIESLVKSLRLLYYSREMEIKTIDIKQVIASVSNIFHNKMKNRVEISYKIPEKLELKANQEAFLHIFINLISNAIDAIKERGKIEILIRNPSDPVIHIKDTGCGINEKNLKTIFNPFYTNKEVGKGTGLGLYIVKDLIMKMGWKIDVKSKEGKGTEFIIRTGG